MPARPQNAHPPGLSAYRFVDAPVFCIVTRIKLRHFWSMPLVWRRFREVQRQAKQIPQLKRSVFLLDGPHTFFTFSIWEGEGGYLEFGTRAKTHVQTIRQIYPLIAQVDGRPEIWSAEWQVRATGRNLNWGSPSEWFANTGEAFRPIETSILGDGSD